MFVVMSCRRYVGKAFHTRGPAAEKILLPKLLCVRGTPHIPLVADRISRSSAVSIGNELNVGSHNTAVFVQLTTDALGIRA